MPNRHVYAQSGGEPDMSRWLKITPEESDRCTIHLQDLCAQGRPCTLTLVKCPLKFLQAATRGGALQVSTHEGYLLIRRDGAAVTVEFRGREDKAAIKASLIAAELDRRIQEIWSEMHPDD